MFSHMKQCCFAIRSAYMHGKLFLSLDVLCGLVHVVDVADHGIKVCVQQRKPLCILRTVQTHLLSSPCVDYEKHLFFAYFTQMKKPRLTHIAWALDLPPPEVSIHTNVPFVRTGLQTSCRGKHALLHTLAGRGHEIDLDCW